MMMITETLGCKIINVKTKDVNFGKIEIGELFFVKNNGNFVECEKLTNNMADDEKGNIYYIVSSDIVKVKY